MAGTHQGSPGEDLGIWQALVKFEGRYGEYAVGLDSQGIKATPVEINGKLQEGLVPFSLAWSELSLAEQKLGFMHWGIIFHMRGSTARCEVWLLYEHFYPSVFHRIEEKFSDRISFRAATGPNWKVIAIPIVLALFWAALAIWAFQAGHIMGGMLLWLAVLASVAYAGWIIRRPK